MATPGEPIAIVGSACRFPGGASSPSKLWDLLKQPRDVLRTISAEERFNPKAFYHPDGTHHGASNVTESYLLEEDPRVFDAGFFNFKPIEAHATDPQHRILLETVYEALETAGMPMEVVAGSQTAVFVGQMWSDYSDHLQRDLDSLPTYAGVGTARSILSNRISHFFDWHGPSSTIDTACSSSLVAVYNAIQTLRSGDAPMAVVAGANLILTPEPYVGESKLKMLSHDSRSRMWDADAKGYARGDGVAALILKPLSRALADGDDVECVIRECLVNQDGRTPEGITMPSSKAQAELIRRTYAKAGLDPSNPQDRCQFFEAHGTGTAAGDPREAEAIAEAFFGQAHKSALGPSDRLYVGSIKTIIGHTEGTAGIAGILKASLALQRAQIPPNMFFDRLSPAVAPFYHSLEIPTHNAKPWPALAHPDSPRRASVNSFGFGGTNAHVILENYNILEIEPVSNGHKEEAVFLLSPLVFSAASDKSLRGMIRQYVSYLDEKPSTNLGDLAFTLSRRSVLANRVSFAAQSTQELAAKMTAWLSKTSSSSEGPRRARPSSGPSQARILGVFTGQGAQWATMGRRLINDFPRVREILRGLDHALATVPRRNDMLAPPTWSIIGELTADASTSHVGEAVFSQPLCTAIQIVLVDLLRAAGVVFKAVVGHSSGEIGAAYAAGFLSASDAIRIAYYRGCVAALAGGRGDEPGAMLAAGTTLQDAEEICGLDTLEGRICVAAVNSSSSITLSGDSDAVEEARMVLADESKFARRLKVDKAYHSHHMLPCVSPYLEAMANAVKLDYSAHDPEPDCAWYSSVRLASDGHGARVRRDWGPDLAGQYWCDNMAKPVLFVNAVRGAWAHQGPFDAIVEIGPHPALKGPTMQTIQELMQGGSEKTTLPTHTAVLARDQDDIESFSNGLGALFCNLSHGSVDLGGLDRFLSSGASSPRRLLKGLPSYSWDHDRVYWHESRLSRAYRTRTDPPHPLLGTLLPDGVEKEMRWRNLIRVSELPWVKGHTLQSQVVFPAAGYIVTAMEAALALAAARKLDIKLLEVQRVVIGRALTLEDNVDVETLVSLSDIQIHDEHANANFSFHAALHRDASNVTLLAHASVEFTFGTTLSASLPAREDEFQPNLLEVDTDDFYAFLDEVGYGYTGPFRALHSMSRRLDHGTGCLALPPQEEENDFLVHPAFLDASFQSIFLAMGWPRDAGLVEVFVPVEFQSIKVDVSAWRSATAAGAQDMRFDSQLRQTPESVTGDVDVFSEDILGSTTLVQVENIKVVPFSPASAASTRRLYSRTTYWPTTVDGLEASGARIATDQEREMAWDLERVGIYYLRAIEAEFPIQRDPGCRDNLEPHHRYFFDFSGDVLSRVSRGVMPYSKKEWLDDTWDRDIAPIFDRYTDSLDLQLMQKVGENMAAAIRGHVNMVEILFQGDFMDRFYAGALGLDLTMDWLGHMVSQLSRRYPHMNILELGGGTGGATKSVFAHIGEQFASYTFTDISAGFFPVARSVFSSHGHKLSFKTLDVEKDIAEQGFQSGGYDLIIASNVLHATASIDETLRNARRLLKPGGFLLIAEVACADVVRVRLPFSALPGWWRGHDDGRPLTATIEASEWHERLQRTGFSGIDANTSEFEPLVWPSLVILSQAVDDRISLLREPLMHQPPQSAIGDQHLVLVGGETARSSGLVGHISRTLAPWFGSSSSKGGNVIRVRSLEDLVPGGLSSAAELLPPRAKCTIINLADLDRPVLDGLTEASFAGLKQLVEYPHSMLWVTSGCRKGSPKMNMSVGLGRVLLHEMPGLNLQFLDIETSTGTLASTVSSTKNTARLIAEAFLRWRALADYRLEGADESNFLWAREHELVLEMDTGLTKVPRIAFDDEMNVRYNASRKIVAQDTNVRQAPVYLHRIGAQWRFVQSAGQEVEESLPVMLSSAMPCHGGMYVAIGTDPEIDGQDSLFVTMVANNSSHVSKVGATKVSINNKGNEIPRERWAPLLAQLMTELHVSSILDALPHSTCVVLYEPSPDLARSILARADEKDLRVVLATTSDDEQFATQPWVTVGRHDPKRLLRSRLPADISVFVDCLEEPDTTALRNVLPDNTQRLCLRDLVHQKPRHTQKSGETELMAALSRLKYGTKDLESEVQLKSLDQLDLSRDLDSGLSLVLKWQPESARDSCSVPAVVPAVDAFLSFKADRTYILFGLTSDLGQSLCDWMATHGARHLVMTSRTPNVDSRWLEARQSKGITVRVFANDITNGRALRAVIDEIRRTMPPIGGIANGAMVLRDKPFLDMSLEMMTQTLDTKVKGSEHLDAIFSGPLGHSLDFFVLFSSIAAVTGNRAQSNYSAANMFMTALANNRRQRGLAASVMHIGAIMGVGYMARNLTRAILDNLWAAGATWISEKDFHNCFAEAVLAGRPDSPGAPEFIVGLRQLVQGRDSREKVLVMDDTRFSHLVSRDVVVAVEAEDGTGTGSSRTSSSIKHLLQAAKTPKAVERIVRNGFMAKLTTTLQLDAEMPEFEILNSRADELGVDSLVSVDFRAWFSSEMGVEMPVLKLLGGSTISELVAFSLEKLAPGQTPNLTEAGKDEEEIEEAAEEALSNAQDRKDKVAEQPALPRVESSLEPNSHPSASLPTNSSRASSPFSVLTYQPTPSSSEPDDSVLISRPSSTHASSEQNDAQRKETSAGSKRVPLAAGQSRFLFLNHLVTDKSAFNITFRAKLHARIKVDNLAAAVQTVASAHDALRTSFDLSSAIPVQVVHNKPRLALEHVSVRHEAEAKQIFEDLKSHAYDLGRGDVIRMILLSLSNEEHYLVIGYHHIIMDGISLEVFLADLERAYQGQPALAPVQFSEFCTKQSQALQSDALSDEESFWRKELANPKPPAALPLLPFSVATQRRALDKYVHAQVQRRISRTQRSVIQATCTRARTNMFHFFTATYAALLSRHLKVHDLCIGMADSGREMGAYAHSIGMYLNLLPIRLGIDSSHHFAELLQHAKRKVNLATAHGRLPFDRILAAAGPGVERSDTHNPLFQAFINYRPGVSENRMLFGGEGHVAEDDWESGTTSYDIMLDIVENPTGETTLRFIVQSSLYSAEDAKRLMKDYLALLDAYATNPDQLVETPFLSPSLPESSAVAQTPVQQQQQPCDALALSTGASHAPAWSDETLLHRIGRIARQQPNSLAVTNGLGSTLTYSALMTRVKAIAKAVLTIVVPENSSAPLVGVFCEPSLDSICCLLAVMWAGCAYVPLDPTLPDERLGVLTTIAQPDLILSHNDTAGRAQDLSTHSHISHLNVSRITATSSHNELPILAKADQPMAVHFTSGTTGTPKGVVLYHSAVANVVEACAGIYRTATASVLQQTALNFDMALWQILVALSSGGKLVVVPQDKRLDMATEVPRLIRLEKVTLTIATPSEYALWLSESNGDLQHHRPWQIAVIGGEPYSSQVDRNLRALDLPQLRLLNFYGPSEVSFVSHYVEVTPAMAASDDAVPVGFPLSNYSAYVLDSNQQPVSVGSVGEVFIAGAGVSRTEYLGNPELTSQKFVHDPFALEFAKSRGWTRMYCTGDRGRLNSDGSLTLLGRVEGDTQIKIRGVRMELDEVERAVLKQADGMIEQVVVTTRGEGENRVLVAHARLSAAGKIRTAFDQDGLVLGRVLQSLTGLPKVMRPAVIVPVDSLPLTVHKKVDRRAVAALAIPGQPQHPVASAVVVPSRGTKATDDKEQEILQIWTQVLGRGLIEAPGKAAVGDLDFFSLGGTSLQLVGVQRQIRERFQVEVPVVELFQKSLLKSMTDLVISKSQPASAASKNAVSMHQESTIDWDAETRFSLPSSKTQMLPSISPVRQPPCIVALTGATGFVGQAILRRLVATPGIDHVHCLAVRDPLRLDAPLRLDPKVSIHQGDLCNATLSLAAETIDMLASSVDLIIHNGADVSFLKPYTALRAPNVASTAFLAAHIAAPRRIPITYISSVVVGRLLVPAQDDFAPVSVAHCPPAPGFRDAYGASKWASEVLLERASRELGMPVAIRRLSSVTGSGMPESDVMGNLVAFSERLAAVPVTAKWRGALDFVSVERVAQNVVQEAMSWHAKEGSSASVVYRHDCSDEVVALDGLGESVAQFIGRRLLGRPVAVLPMAEWIGRAKRIGLSDLVAAFLEKAEEEPGVAVFQKLLTSTV